MAGDETRGRVRPWMIALALTVLGAIVRFAALGTQAFDFDEAFTVVRVLPGSLGDVIDRVPQTESSPPLYYVLAKGWTGIFGAGEVDIRSLSALLGTAVVPVAWALGRRVAGARAGVIAGLLVAVNPVLVYYSQVARTYALLAALGGLAVLLGLRLRDAPTPRGVALWTGVSILALLAHYFAAFVVLPVAVLIAIRHRTPAVLAGLGAIAFTGLALLPLALRQSDDGRTDWISAISFPRRVGELPVKTMLGEYWFATPPLLLLVLIVPVALAVLALVIDRDRARSVVPLLAVAVAAFAVPAVVDAVSIDVVDAKNMIAAAMPTIVVIGVGLASARLGPAGPVAVAILAVGWLGLDVATAVDPGLQRADYRAAANAIGPGAGPRAIVVPRGGSTPLEVYRPGVTPLEDGAPVREIDLLAPIARRRFVGPDETEPVTPAPPVPGFVLAGRIDGDDYTLVRYRAPRALPVSRPKLLGARIGPPGAPSVYLER